LKTDRDKKELAGHRLVLRGAADNRVHPANKAEPTGQGSAQEWRLGAAAPEKDHVKPLFVWLNRDRLQRFLRFGGLPDQRRF
jgi:hypothetical protein